ncbi:MAG: tetratricopeptide repeat protein [Verrucomicrobiota bacterium]
MAIKTEKDLSENARSLWLKALTAVELRNFGYANSLLQAVLKETPEFLEARRVLRRSQITATKGKKAGLFGGFSASVLKGAQVLKKDPAAALDIAEKTLESDPFNSPANHLLKDAAIALDYYETALFALQTLADGDPKDTKVLHEMGELLMAHGEAEKAVAIYNKILEITPSDLIANKRSKDAAAANSMKVGGWETAKDYRDLIKNKDEAIALEQKNRVVKSADDIDDLLEELHREVEAQPENIDLARRVAGLYEQKDDMENAIAWYHYASELSKGTDSWLLRKLSDLQLKQIELAVTAREEWLEAVGNGHEESPRVLQELEDFRMEKAKMLLAEARKRMERNPSDLQVRYELGEQLMYAGDYSEAIRELQRARQNPNVRLRAMNLLGQCYSKKGMLDLAIKQFKDAASEIEDMDATKKGILYQLGLLYEKMNDGVNALECFKQIYEVDYGYSDVAERVERSYGS